MNVLLIDPPTDRAIRSEAGAAGGVRYPPLGLLYLQAGAEKAGAGRVKILDVETTRDLLTALSAHRANPPDVVGIAALTPNLPGVALTVRRAKEAFPRATVVVGGPHATLFPRETASLLGVDVALTGEAEETFPRLLQRLSRGEGGADARDAVSPAPQIADLDALPLPDRARLPIAAYRGLAGDNEIFTTMLTSRGCPYRCTFCSTPHGVTRLRSVESVLAEADQCRALGVEHIYFVDDTFPLRGERLANLCAGLAQRRGAMCWSSRTAAAIVDEPALRLMKESGCRRIQIGVETGTEEGLRVLGKPARLDDFRHAFSAARRVGLETMGYFMLGLPTERNAVDVRATVRCAKSLDPDFAMFNVLTLYPGAALYDDARARGLIAGDPWRAFAVAPTTDFDAPVWSESLPREALFALLREAYRSFYWRPRIVLRQLRRQRGFRGLLRKAALALRMLTGRAR